MTALLFASLLWQFVDFLKELTNFKTQRSAVLTQLVAWISGIALVWIVSAASIGKSFSLPGFPPLGQLNFWDTVIVGLLASSLASSAVDVKQALDGSDSAGKPPLIPPASSTPAAPSS